MPPSLTLFDLDDIATIDRASRNHGPLDIGPLVSRPPLLVTQPILDAVMEKPAPTAPPRLPTTPAAPAPKQATASTGTVTAPPQTTPSPATADTASTDFVLHGGARELSRGWIARARDNIAAIRIAHSVENEKRTATPEEQAALSRFVAFSATALSQTMFPAPGAKAKPEWQPVIDELEAETTAAERAHLMRSTQYAHYTPEPVISAIWRFVQDNIGFQGGRALEPGCGPGLFLSMAPEAIRASTRFTGVELDPLTAAIARALHPRQQIIEADFTKWAARPVYDLAIGNPPFAATTLSAPEGYRNPNKISLHTWFIARAMSLVSPGGLGVFVCSRYLLDRENDSGRAVLDEKSDFLGAVRMPENGLSYGNDTGVVADILVFRRREDGRQIASSDGWLDVVPFSCDSPHEKARPGTAMINGWLAKHPENVLGRNDVSSSAFGPAYTCRDDNRIASCENDAAKAKTFSDTIYAALSRIVPARTATERVLPDRNGPTLTELTGADIILGEIPPGTSPAEEKQSPAPELEPANEAGHEPDVAADTPERKAAGEAAMPNDVTRSLFGDLLADFEPSNAPTRETSLEDLCESVAATVGTAATNARLKENSYVVVGGILHQINNRYPHPVPLRRKDGRGFTARQEECVRALIPIRNLVHDILDAQAIRDASDTDSWSGAQKELRREWDRFVARFRPINHAREIERVNPKDGRKTTTNSYPNLAPFGDDPDCYLVASIETYDQDTDTATPGAIFNSRILFPPGAPSINSAHDALAVVLDRSGLLDMEEIARLAGLSVDEAISELGDRIYPDIERPHDNAWVLAEEATSGNVRRKSRIAKELAESDSRFKAVSEAISAAVPGELTPSDITIKLGVPWITTDVVAAFSAEIMGVRAIIKHNATVACWDVDKSLFSQSADSTTKWGTARRSAGYILEDALNSRVPQIYDTEINQNGNKVQVLNTVETEAAKDRLATMQEAFIAWVWNDAERSISICGHYNETFNNTANRTYDGSHLTLPGKSAAIQLRRFQKNAIWRAVASGNTYIVHCVGAGKSYTIAGTTMEMQRLGLVTKPMIAVPNHCLVDFASSFMRMYPQAKILVADEINFHKDKRQRFVSRMTMNRWDAIIISHDAFKLIPAPADFEKEMGDREMMLLDAAIADAAENGSRFSRKRLEAQKAALAERLDRLKGAKDDMVTLAETGVDHITVDEAHLYRKLSFTTNQSTLKGVDPDGSQRAWDLYVKTRYLDERSAGRHTINLASGTPITNTIGELFTVMRFMAPEVLRSQGVDSFDAWLATYGQARTELELQPSGLYKPVTRLTEFVNVADMMASFRLFADIVLRDQLEQEVVLPKLRSGARQILVSEPSDAFTSYQKHLLHRIVAIENRGGKPQKGDDILLSVINDGRHAAIDLRLVGYDQNEPSNKLNMLVRNSFRIWKENRENIYINPKNGLPYSRKGAVQMIFSDLGTESVAKTRGFSPYLWIKSELVRMGVPEEEIIFIQHHKTPSARSRVFSAANEGRITFLIGASANMGTGANAQQRMVAEHHLDIPWLCADLEQREGRIIRQGNQNETIDIFAYATKGSVDATSWQRLEQKCRFINMAFTGDRTVRRIADVGDTVAQFAMAKALASGDDRLIRKGDLEAKIAKLKRMRAAHANRKYEIRTRIHNMRERTEQDRESVQCYQTMLTANRAADPDVLFKDTDGTVFRPEDEKEAGKAISRRLRNITLASNKQRNDVGTWKGVKLIGSCSRQYLKKGDYETRLLLTDGNYDLSIRVDCETPPHWIISHLNGAIASLASDLDDSRRNLAKGQEMLDDFEAMPDEDFEAQKELDDGLSELLDIDKSLAADVLEKGKQDNEDGDLPPGFSRIKRISDDDIDERTNDDE